MVKAQAYAANEATIVGGHGGFADCFREHWSWAIPLPAGMDMSRPVHYFVEELLMNKVNEAIKHLQDGKARFRIVLKN